MCRDEDQGWSLRIAWASAAHDAMAAPMKRAAKPPR